MKTKFKSKITRVLLVDDHAMVREGLAEALSREHRALPPGDRQHGPIAA